MGAWNIPVARQQTTGTTSMTVGKNNGSPRLRRLAVFLACSFLLGPAATSAAETSPQSEREEGSRAWNVERLIESLSKSLPSEVRYEETSFSTLLTKPLKTEGILRVTPPATLEKHVTAPHVERYLVEGDTVFFTSKAKGVNRTLSLQDYPGLRAVVEAFRSFLSNDVVTLKRGYGVKLASSGFVSIVSIVSTSMFHLSPVPLV